VLLPWQSKGITVSCQKKKQGVAGTHEGVEVERQTVEKPFLIKHRRAAKAVVLTSRCSHWRRLCWWSDCPRALRRRQGAGDQAAGLYAFTFAFFNIMTAPSRPGSTWSSTGARVPVPHRLGHAHARIRGRSRTTVLATTFYRGSPLSGSSAVALGFWSSCGDGAAEEQAGSRLEAVHILNYLIFLAIFIKAMIIGTTCPSPPPPPMR